MLGGVARTAFKLCAELCERAFAHILDRGGVRRTWLRGRDNVAKRYLVHVAGFNLALLMRALTGAGTPRTAAEAATAALRGGPIYLHADDTTLLIPFVLDPSGIRSQWPSSPSPPSHRFYQRAVGQAQMPRVE